MENKVVTLKINSDFGSAEADLKSLGIAVKNVDKEATNLDATFEEIYGDLKPLTARMGEAEDRLYELSLAGKQNTKEFKELLKAVGNYRQVQIQTDLVVDAAATKLFPKLTQSLNAVAGGFSIAQGAIGLFGNESESVEKAMLKVQSAMAISQGFESINQSKNSITQLGLKIKETSIVQKTLTAATAAYTFVTQASTTGLKLFRGALIGTGIGVIVVGLGLLIANFDKVKQTIMSVIPGLSSVGKVIGGIVDSITDFVGVTSDASRALDKLKKDADNTLSVNKKFMSEHSDQLDEYTKKKIEAKNAYSEAIKEDGANQNELAKKLNRELAAIEFSRGDEKRKILKDANDKAASERKANNKKDADDLIEQKKKDAEDLKAGIKSAQDTEIALRNELTQVIGDAQDKQSEFLISESEAEERIVKDKYFRLLELAKQQNRSKEEIDVLQIQKENELNDIRNVAKEKQDAIDKTNKDKRDADEMAAEKAKFEQKKAIQDAGFNLASGAVNFLKEIGGKSKAIQKAAIIAENAIGIGKMIIANNAANIGALATPQAIATSGAAAVPVIAMNNITTALGVATTIAATAKALGAVGGGAAGSAGSVGGGMSAPAAPSFNVVGASSTNQLAQTIGSKEQQPIKAYVVANDVTTQQGLDRNIVQSASIG